MFEVVAKKTVTDGNGNFYTNQITSSVSSEEEVEGLQETLNGMVDAAIEQYAGFEVAESSDEEDYDEDEEEEYDEDESEEEDEDEEYEDEEYDDEEEEDEDDEDEDEDEDELTEDEIMKMKKSELVDLIDEEELEIDIKGMKIKEIREAVIDELFAEEDEDEEYDEEFDEDEE